jgi:hypothetical protein
LNDTAAADHRRALRSKLAARVEDIDGPFFARLTKCGERFSLHCTCCGRTREVERRCNWKCCPVCQHALTAQSADRFARISAQCQWPLLVTFNAEHTEHEGIKAFREMRAALIRLRAQAWWKARVKGGIACWEVSRLSKAERRKRRLGPDRGWHFHCHCLIDCRWLYQSILPPRHGCSDAERKARVKAINEEIATTWTGTLRTRAGTLDVRRVWLDSNGGIEGAVHEVCKYAMTGAQLADSDYDIEPVLWALEKTRMIAGFGTFYRHPDIKRRRGSGVTCECGAKDWMPDSEVDYACRTARKNRR